MKGTIFGFYGTNCLRKKYNIGKKCIINKSDRGVQTLSSIFCAFYIFKLRHGASITHFGLFDPDNLPNILTLSDNLPNILTSMQPDNLPNMSKYFDISIYDKLHNYDNYDYDTTKTNLAIWHI